MFDFLSFKKLNEVLGWKELLDMGARAVFGKGGHQPSSESSKPAAAIDNLKSNAFGNYDEQALLFLMAMYGVPDEALGEHLKAIVITPEQRSALSHLFAAMNDKEAERFKQAIARGGEQPITVKVPMAVRLTRTGKDGKEYVDEKMGSREWTVMATLRGSHVLRGIAQDIIEGNDTDAKKKNRAKAIVAEFRQAGIFKDWSDKLTQAWEKIKEAKPGTSVYALRMEAYFRWHLGNEGFNYIYRSKRAQAFQAEVDAAKTPKTKAIAERCYWDQFGIMADMVLDPDIQASAAEEAGITHPNKLLWRVVFGVMGFVLIGFGIIIVIAQFN